MRNPASVCASFPATLEPRTRRTAHWCARRTPWQTTAARAAYAIGSRARSTAGGLTSLTARTSLTLAPRATAQYGFRMQWADSYDEMRDILYHERLFDIRVVPGMTLPSDLAARFALHTRARIDSIAEHPDHTAIAASASRRGRRPVHL